ncbi:hypothetical protein BT96DRAFT_975309 [Gymnopus androsaceus JB14]|uniref:Uncharacterized protein n=1 Tax=Gymnopus androsaceus JB14 TaxID=1447944 RepID=A0A6A4HT01_9AGAR|nr:hypothetical protein BT96DRAFT_975309 [Gymnopus androsaceus JB14]
MCSPPTGHIWLFIESVPTDPDALYLEIPLYRIRANCLKPAKYLRFIAYTVTALDGSITLAPQNQLVADDSQLEDQAVYIFNPAIIIDKTARAALRADQEIVLPRSQWGGSQSNRNIEFVNGIYSRDAVSVFKLKNHWGNTQAIHTIPFARGDQWLQQLIDERPGFEGDEGVIDMESIDDIRNGFCGDKEFHGSFDRNEVGVIKTPNHILAIDEIPSAPTRTLAAHTSYPPNLRYTYQYLHDPDGKVESDYGPNNVDGAFQNSTTKPFPSPFLLHCRFGAAALYNWGKNLQKQIPPSRPPKEQVVYGYHPQKDTGGRAERAARQDNRHMAEGSEATIKGSGRETEAVEGVMEEGKIDTMELLHVITSRYTRVKVRFVDQLPEKQREISEWAKTLPVV